MKTKLMALEALKLARNRQRQLTLGLTNPDYNALVAAIAALEADIAKPVDNSEQSAFEDWITRTKPSGDVESVQSQWIASGDYADLYTTPQEPAAAGWVSVDDRLPEPWTEVLVYPRPSDYCCEAQMGRAGCGIYWEYSEYEAGFGDVKHRCNVTHWMPLPAAPGGVA